jgi:hypothetical protein
MHVDSPFRDVLAEYVNEYRNQRVNKTLKGMSVESALNGVVALILNKQAGWNKPMQLPSNATSSNANAMQTGSAMQLAALDSFQQQMAAAAADAQVRQLFSRANNPPIGFVVV